MADDPKTPIETAIDQALDLLVYAPLGLALMARDQLPALIERGRSQVNQQTMLAKMMGQYAVKEADRQLRERMERRSAPAPTPAPAATAAAAEPATTNGQAAKPAEAPAPPAPATAPAAPKSTGDHLAIPGYDTLSASQVVQRLPGLNADELDAVRAYEAASRGRRTILTKISQLQSGTPS